MIDTLTIHQLTTTLNQLGITRVEVTDASKWHELLEWYQYQASLFENESTVAYATEMRLFGIDFVDASRGRGGRT